MPDISLSALAATLLILLALSGFFSLAETAMMAANRYRLKHLSDTGHRGAQLAMQLLATTDRLLGIILLFNNLINAAAATLVGVIAIELFGEQKWALGLGTVTVTFLILVFSEITPKVLGAAHADRLAPMVSFVLMPLLRVFRFVVWFVNLFVSGLLWLTRLKPPSTQPHRLTAEELRSLVLEAGHFIPQQHQSILLNLFQLERVTVEDIMTPRSAIEAIDIQGPLEEIKVQLATSYHARVPVYEGEPNNVIGVLHQRRLISALIGGELDRERLRSLLSSPYFVPAATPIYAQLQFFKDNQQRIAFIVDEYGDILGLVTLEDIIEEIVGKFTTSVPVASADLAWGDDDSVLVEGSRTLRELNRQLSLNLPLDGPKTLNGLIIEHFRDIPEAGVGVKIADVAMEIVQTHDRMVRTVRVFRP